MISSALPRIYADAVSTSVDAVGQAAEAYGKAVADVFEQIPGMKQYADAARYAFPHYARVAAGESFSNAFLLTASGGNPVLAAMFKGWELAGRGVALGIIPNPVPFA